MMMAINRTRGTAIGGALFVSLLISETAFQQLKQIA